MKNGYQCWRQNKYNLFSEEVWLIFDLVDGKYFSEEGIFYLSLIQN